MVAVCGSHYPSRWGRNTNPSCQCLNSSTRSLVISAGILALTSFEATLFIDVITAVIGIGITFFIPVPELTTYTEEEGSTFQGIKEGFLYVKQYVFIRDMLVYLFIVLFLTSSFAFLTPLMVNRSFGEEVWRLSASEMVYSIGAAAGGFLIAMWSGFKNRMLTSLVGCAGYGLFIIGLGCSTVFWVYLMFHLLLGLSTSIFNIPLTVLLQEKVEPTMQGRIFSLLQVSYSTALPLGMVVFGPLADVIQIESIFIIVGFLVYAITIYKPIRKRSNIE